MRSLCIRTANRKDNFPHPKTEHPTLLPAPWVPIFTRFYEAVTIETCLKILYFDVSSWFFECLIPNKCWLKDQISSSFIWVSVIKNGAISFRTSNQRDPCLNLPSRETWFNRGSDATSRDSKNVSLYLQNRVDVHACGVDTWSNWNPYRLTTVCCHDENFCAWVKHKFCPTNIYFRSDAVFFVSSR